MVFRNLLSDDNEESLSVLYNNRKTVINIGTIFSVACIM